MFYQTIIIITFRYTWMAEGHVIIKETVWGFRFFLLKSGPFFILLKICICKKKNVHNKIALIMSGNQS